MFSGKSSELIKRINKYKLLGKRVLVITHESDTRYSNGQFLVSHDLVKESAVSTSHLHSLLLSEQYDAADVICIDEAQFFDDLYTFVVYGVDHDSKCMIVAGLDGNYKREPFQQVVNLIPFADDVMKTRALCLLCSDGTLASFSKKINQVSHETIDVGGAEKYQSVCRHHYASI